MRPGYARAAFVVGIAVVGLQVGLLAGPDQPGDARATAVQAPARLMPVPEALDSRSAVNPYARLFPIPPATSGQGRRPAPEDTSAKPSLVCGMLVIDADPTVDPRFFVTLPNSDTVFTMRRLDFDVCH